MSLFAPETVDVSLLPSVAFRDRGKLSNQSALYFVVDANTQSVIYVGQTISLMRRWMDHHLLKTLKSYANVRICWLALDALLLSTSEDLAITHWRPPLNRQWKECARMPKAAYEKILIRVPSDMMAQLKDRSVREDRSINGELIHLVRQALRVEDEDHDHRRRAPVAS
jgi:Arc-like DNA binding dprotein